MNRILKPALCMLLVNAATLSWAVDVHQIVVPQTDGTAIEPAHLDNVLSDPNRNFHLDRATAQWIVDEKPKSRALMPAEAAQIAAEETKIRAQLGRTSAFQSHALLHFAFDSTNPSSWSALSRMLPKLRHSADDIIVIGHADEKGTDEYNQRLSEARAARVERYLVAHGVSKSRIEAEGRGKREPIALGTGAANRRVVVNLASANQETSE